MPFLGDRFRAAREARGLSLADVSEHIHIRAVYLDCIEREDWPAIGAPVYTRGFVRSYARFLGLEPDQAVTEYALSSGTPNSTPTATLSAAMPPPPKMAPPPREIPQKRQSPSADAAPQAPPVASVAPKARPERPQRSAPPPPPSRAASPPRQNSPRPRTNTGGGPSPLITILGLIALVLVGAVGYTLYDQATRAPAHTSGGGVGAVPLPTLVAVSHPAPRPTAPPERTLAFTVNAKSWVQIAIDGQAPVAATLDKGTTKVFHGKSAVLRVGNAGGVVVTVNGKTLGPLGASGAVVERTFAL